MKLSKLTILLIGCLTLITARTARAGAPQPDQRQGDFAHVCRGGVNKAQPCTVATEAADCPASECVLTALSKPINATLTIVAHDSVTDWLNGGATNRALTVMLEVRGPDRKPHLLAATYQDLTQPTEPPSAPGNIVAIPMDEAALRGLPAALDGMLFLQPEAALRQQLQTLFATTGTPALVGVGSRSALLDDHTADGLATVLRFKVKLRFLSAL